MKKGQLSVEFLAMLAILLVILGVFIFISQESEMSVRQAKIQNEAETTIKDLSAAAKEVYALGEGTSKQVYVTIPEGYEPGSSFVGNRSIRIMVAGSDYVSIEQFDVHGTLPATAGNHWIWVMSEGNGVRIGFAMIEVDKPSIALSMGPGESRSVKIKIKNIWTGPVNVSISKQWGVDVDLLLSEQTAEINPAEQKGITVLFKADDNTVGMFAGLLNIRATDGDVEEYISVPLTLIVKGDDAGAVSKKLFVLPSSINETMMGNSTLIRSFQVCTDSETYLDEVELRASLDTPGVWVSGPDSIGPINKGDCTQLLINISTPLDADIGEHTGWINLSATGVSDKIDLSITIGGDPTDLDGPLINEIIGIGPYFVNSPLSFISQASDNKTRIKQCEIKVDNSTWELMYPADGTFDSLEEEAVFNHDGLEYGDHNVYSRCTDSAGNVGKSKNMSFRLIKEMLFLKISDLPTQSEKEWMDWLSVHGSRNGFNWEFDVGNVDQLASVDLNEYAVVVMADYENDETLNTKLLDHRDNGGYVVLLGEANEEGVFALCQTNQEVFPSPAKNVRVFLNDHYITSQYSMTSLQVFTLDTKLYSIDVDYIGKPLVMDEANKGLTVLGLREKILSWGVAHPFRFNQEGIDLTTAAIDFALLDSEKE
jgi:hypothetical protein